MKITGIYGIYNFISHKWYIGQSINIKDRWSRHIRSLNNGKSSNKLQRAWNKYGEENFEFMIIEECLKEQLNARETFWFEYYDSIRNGYNTTSDPENKNGYKHSEETKKKISECKRGLKHSKETREKISENNKGKRSGIRITEETRKKLKESHIGKKGGVGFRHSKEQKKIWSESRKGSKVPQERREKISKSMREFHLKKRLNSIT